MIIDEKGGDFREARLEPVAVAIGIVRCATDERQQASCLSQILSKKLCLAKFLKSFMHLVRAGEVKPADFRGE
jgi:hypothetical protein